MKKEIGIPAVIAIIAIVVILVVVFGARTMNNTGGVEGEAAKRMAGFKNQGQNPMRTPAGGGTTAPR